MAYFGMGNGPGTMIRRIGGAIANDNAEPAVDGDWEAFLSGIEERTDRLLKGATPLDASAPREIKAMVAVWRMLDRDARLLRAREQGSLNLVPPACA